MHIIHILLLTPVFPCILWYIFSFRSMRIVGILEKALLFKYFNVCFSYVPHPTVGRTGMLRALLLEEAKKSSKK